MKKKLEEVFYVQKKRKENDLIYFLHVSKIENENYKVNPKFSYTNSFNTVYNKSDFMGN